jgi:hypothetical protein
MSTLSATGVEPEATHLVATQEKAFDSLRLAISEASKIFEQRRTALIGRQEAGFIADIGLPALKRGLETGSAAGAFLGALQGFANVVGREAEEGKQIRVQTARFSDSWAAFQRERMAYETEKERIVASFASKFSSEDWDFLKPPASANSPAPGGDRP